jgi:hypothetical protein
MINPPKALATAFLVAVLTAASSSAHPVDEQANFVFDTLGPIACELPPPNFDISPFRALADSQDTPLAIGEISGALDARIAGGVLYGADAGGGHVVNFQGMLLDDDPELRMLCLVLVRLGEFDAQAELAAAIVGEEGLDAASDGDFLGVLKIVRRDVQGNPEVLRAGRVDGGSARMDAPRDGSMAGTISIQGRFTMAGLEDVQPFASTMTFPFAQDAIRPALRLTRN